MVDHNESSEAEKLRLRKKVNRLSAILRIAERRMLYLMAGTDHVMDVKVSFHPSEEEIELEVEKYR